MKRYLYWFSFADKEKETAVEGTSISTDAGVIVVSEGRMANPIAK